MPIITVVLKQQKIIFSYLNKELPLARKIANILADKLVIKMLKC